MAEFDAHIKQVKKNLLTLSQISVNIPDSWDWQVTCAYYVGVHLMNAHLAKTLNLHYKTHSDVKNAIFNEKWPCKIPDDEFAAYVSLENNSRRARYLCHEKVEQTDSTKSYQTYDKHLKKSLVHLDCLLNYFAKKYKLDFEVAKIDCVEIKNLNLKYFNYVQQAKSA